MSSSGWLRMGIPLLIVALITMVAGARGRASHMNAAEGDPAAPWTVHIQQVEEALARKNPGGAEQAWHEAYLAALGSRRWEGMVEAGDAYLRIGKTFGSHVAAEAKARRLYLDAFVRARQQRSLDGMLRVAEAFAALGDREVAQQVLQAAEGLATQSRDGRASDRVRAFREQAARFLDMKGP